MRHCERAQSPSVRWAATRWTRDRVWTSWILLAEDRRSLASGQAPRPTTEIRALGPERFSVLGCELGSQQHTFLTGQRLEAACLRALAEAVSKPPAREVQQSLCGKKM